MKFIRNTNSYDVDLNMPEAERWFQVMTNEKSQLKRIFKEAQKNIEDVLPSGTSGIVKGLFSYLYRSSGGKYVGEIESMSDFLDVSAKDLLFLQCAFELNQLILAFPYSHPVASTTLDTVATVRDTAITVWESIFGCTAGICSHPELGMLHFRTLDWDLKQIGAATRIFNFHKGRRLFVVVGILGLVGALSGMLPSAYSVTINFAPAIEDPGFDFGPLFLLREVLEECDSYGDVVSCLKRTPLSSNVFFTVCGTKRNEACIIERTRNSSSVREFDGSPLVQGNHFHASRFLKHNEPFEDSDFIEDSIKREEKIASRFELVRKSDKMESVFKRADVSPVQNSTTEQRMIFCPRSGRVLVERKCK